jgi:tripartite-type tricarboxylate transporter receptor subunit TctC
MNPGGDTDSHVRRICSLVERELGQPIIITNMAGAGSSIAGRFVKDATPNGYTVLFNHVNIITTELMGIADFGFDDLKTAVIAIEDDSGILIVPSTSRFRTFQDVLDASRRQPMSVRVSTETGAYSHMQWMAIMASAQIQLHLLDVGPFAQVLAAQLAGMVDLSAVQYVAIRDYIISGEFRMLANVNRERSLFLPDVATCKEYGVDIDFPKTFGFWFPKDTPDEIVNRFNAGYARILNHPDFVNYCNNIAFVRAVNITGQDAINYWNNVRDIYFLLREHVTSVESRR